MNDEQKQACLDCMKELAEILFSGVIPIYDDANDILPSKYGIEEKQKEQALACLMEHTDKILNEQCVYVVTLTIKEQAYSRTLGVFNTKEKAEEAVQDRYSIISTCNLPEEEYSIRFHGIDIGL